MELISGFVDTYLKLNQAEEQQFEQELKQASLLEEEKVMEIVTTWMEKGIEQGLKQGENHIIIRQLKRRFSNLSSDLATKINNLSLSETENLGDALLDFQSLDDLINWLDNE